MSLALGWTRLSKTWFDLGLIRHVCFNKTYLYLQEHIYRLLHHCQHLRCRFSCSADQRNSQLHLCSLRTTTSKTETYNFRKFINISFRVVSKSKYFYNFKEKSQEIISSQAIIPFLYPLKTSENLDFYDVFRGYRNGFLMISGWIEEVSWHF